MIPEVQIVQVRGKENKQANKKLVLQHHLLENKRKYPTYQPAELLKAKQYLNKR